MRVLIIVAAAPASLDADISVRRLADRATAAVALHLSDEAPLARCMQVEVPAVAEIGEERLGA